MLIGIFIGIVTVANPLTSHARISRNLIDINLFTTTGLNQGFGRIVFSRLIEFATVTLFLFVINLNRFTAFITFGYFALRTSLLVINVYWSITRFGVMSGVVLGVSYLIILLVVLALFVCLAVYIMRITSGIRRNGFKHGLKCSDALKVIAIFATAMLVIAIIEWLIFWIILSNFIFLNPIV